MSSTEDQARMGAGLSAEGEAQSRTFAREPGEAKRCGG